MLFIFNINIVCVCVCVCVYVHHTLMHLRSTSACLMRSANTPDLLGRTTICVHTVFAHTCTHAHMCTHAKDRKRERTRRRARSEERTMHMSLCCG